MLKKKFKHQLAAAKRSFQWLYLFIHLFLALTSLWKVKKKITSFGGCGVGVGILLRRKKVFIRFNSWHSCHSNTGSSLLLCIRAISCPLIIELFNYYDDCEANGSCVLIIKLISHYDDYCNVTARCVLITGLSNYSVWMEERAGASEWKLFIILVMCTMIVTPPC